MPVALWFIASHPQQHIAIEMLLQQGAPYTPSPHTAAVVEVTRHYIYKRKKGQEMFYNWEDTKFHYEWLTNKNVWRAATDKDMRSFVRYLFT
jgi:hypothetical protein